jgi:predicted alpha/beta hydrolase family esterase
VAQPTDALRSAGHVVAYPRLPDPDEPDLEAWLAAFAAELAVLPLDAERVVVAHSLGCLLWWLAAVRGLVDPPVDRVLLVAPPSPEVTRAHPEIAGFDLPAGVTSEQVSAASRTVTRLVCSDDDEYAPWGADTAYAVRFGLDVDRLSGQAHINPDSGYGDWPSVLAWCSDPTTRLVART